MTENASRSCFILVQVESGIPVGVEIFHEIEMAKSREIALRREMNPDNDEAAIFEVEV